VTHAYSLQVFLLLFAVLEARREYIGGIEVAAAAKLCLPRSMHLSSLPRLCAKAKISIKSFTFVSLLFLDVYQKSSKPWIEKKMPGDALKLLKHFFGIHFSIQLFILPLFTMQYLRRARRPIKHQIYACQIIHHISKIQECYNFMQNNHLLSNKISLPYFGQKSVIMKIFFYAKI
jgi:hypothetical protein